MRLGFHVDLSRDGDVRADLFAPNESAGQLLGAARDGDLLALTLGTAWLASGQSGAAAALAAYRLGGAAGLGRLLRGDFAAVIWDGASCRLLATRDPLGGYPLFWTCHRAGWTLSTSLRAVETAFGGRDLDHGYLAALLCASELTVGELDTPRTCFASVERILPGTCLELRPREDRVATTATVWSWPDEIARIAHRTWEEAAADYRERLDAAVRARLRGRSAAHLSGGMDSTSICALAARALADREPAQKKLHATSLIYADTPALAAETRMIDLALEAVGAVPHRVRSEDHPSFARLHLVPPHDEPAQSSLWAAAEGALIDAARAAGCVTLLTGSGGDFALEAPPYHLADRLARGRWRGVLAEAAAWAQARTTSLRTVVWLYGLRPLLAGLPGGPCRAARHRGPWHRYDGRRAPPWLRAEALRAARPVLAGLRRRDQAAAAGLARGTRLALTLVREHRGDWSRWHLAAPWGIDLAHPFLDPSVAACALSCLERLSGDPRRAKPLLADAMGGLLPAAISCRQHKVDYNDPFFRGLIDGREELERLVLAPAFADLGLVEPAALLDCLRRAALGAAPPAAAMSRLNKALAVAPWVDRNQAAPAEPSPTFRSGIALALGPEGHAGREARRA